MKKYIVGIEWDNDTDGRNWDILKCFDTEETAQKFAKDKFEKEKLNFMNVNSEDEFNEIIEEDDTITLDCSDPNSLSIDSNWFEEYIIVSVKAVDYDD